MSAKLYLIRHGESEANLRGIFASHLAYPLTPKGHEQAEQTALYLKNERIDRIYSSDFPRAYETAVHIAAYHGKEILPHPGLREIYAGDWEGISWKEIEQRYPAEYAVWKTDIGSFCAPGGESVRELQLRGIRAVEEIARANPDRTVCISTHAAILRSMQCYWMKKELCEMHTIPWSANASITTVSYEADGSFHDVFVGRATHLEARNITLPVDW